MVSIVDFLSAEHSHLLEQCRDLHVAAVERDGAMIRYLPPFTDQKKEAMLNFMNTRRDEVIEGSRDIILALDDRQSVLGMVMLSKPRSETGPMRALVELLIVSPEHRKKGIARKLMVRLEEIARENGRTMLRLDTTVGSGADVMYPRLGFIEYGRIPDYGYYAAKNGALAEEVFFYKDLNKSKVLSTL